MYISITTPKFLLEIIIKKKCKRTFFFKPPLFEIETLYLLSGFSQEHNFFFLSKEEKQEPVKETDVLLTSIRWHWQ